MSVRTLIDFDRVSVFAIPVVTRAGGVAPREGMVVDGPQGWGEFSPHIDDPDFVVTRWLTAAIEAGTVGWPDAVRGRVPVAVTVPAVSADRVEEIVATGGCAAAEVKVGDGSLDDDVARVDAVRAALGPDGAIRCDADGGWDVETAVWAIAELEAACGGIQFVEQPCRTLDDVAAVRRRVDVPVAVDQSIRTARQPHALPLTEAADIVVLSCGPLGGVRRALRLAETFALPCAVAFAGTTSIDLAAGLALAGILPELPYACALGARSLAGPDLIAAGRSLVPVDGFLPVAPMPPAPDPALLARYALTDPDRQAWWRDRIRSAH